MMKNCGHSWRVHTLCRLAMLGVVGLASFSVSQAQTVYRCDVKGLASYSYEPCVGAIPVDTTPTQGLDKSSGKSRKGADVRKAERNKSMTDALRPITGLDDKERATLQRRFRLPHAAKLECGVLDVRLQSQAVNERDASPQTLQAAQSALFESRRRFRELHC